MTTATVTPTVQAAGCVFDLARTWTDVYGSRWAWTGETASDGMPLMQRDGDLPERLAHVYMTYGPLIAAPLPPTAAEIRAALTAPSCSPESETAMPVVTPRTLARVLGRLRPGKKDSATVAAPASTLRCPTCQQTFEDCTCGSGRPRSSGGNR